jgi:ribosome recycling factor
MVNDVLRDAEGRMKKTAEALRHHLSSIRTGRASPALVEDLQVEAYGDMLPLNQLATISTPDPRMITIQPFDNGMIRAIEKAIQTSDLGMNPNNDGRVIRLNLPQLTEERRKDLVKQVRSRVEESKIALRNVRREALDDLKQLESEKMISEDDQRRGGDKLQELVDKATKELDQIGAHKEAEVMEI